MIQNMHSMSDSRANKDKMFTDSLCFFLWAFSPV